MSRCNRRSRPVLLLLGVLLVSASGCLPALESEREVEPAHFLTGKPAPLFSTTYLDGQPFDLAQHVGKDIVVLDFWATWCGPCRAAMPALSEVTNEFHDRGVRLLAVNCAEQPEEVKDFVEQSGLELTVIMDPDGKISQDYGAEAIPQTVLIDRQGNVRFVHVGSENMRQWLTEKLTLLANERGPSPGSDETAGAR